MMIDQISNLVISVFSILILGYLGIFAYRSYRIDEFRQTLFELRDELFLFAKEGGIDFKHPAYRLIRQYINGSIRYAESISIWHILFVVSLLKLSILKEREDNFSTAFQKALSDLKEESAQKRMREFHDRCSSFIIKYTIKKSLPILIIILCLLTVICIVALCDYSIKKAKDLIINRIKVRSDFKEIENQFYLMGGVQ